MAMQTTSWHQAVSDHEASGEAYVLVTLIAAVGSTPRASGSKMLISEQHSYDSIGGGQLEFLVIQEARTILAQMAKNSSASGQYMKQFSLGAKAKQCCGGAVTVLFESFAGISNYINIFGAGHVVASLLKILAELPVKVRCIDPRQDLLDQIPDYKNLKKLCHAEPQQLIAELGQQDYSLILTHDHSLDYQLVCAFLDLEYDQYQLGLIGSNTKSERFRRRLISQGYSQQAIDQLRCPVGMPEVAGKRPMEVAISIAAEYLSLQSKEPESNQSASSWKQMKKAIAEVDG